MKNELKTAQGKPETPLNSKLRNGLEDIVLTRLAGAVLQASISAAC